MKIFGEAFDRLKQLFNPTETSTANSSKPTPTFAPGMNFVASQSAAGAAFQNVAGYVQDPEAPPSPFVDDLKAVASANREKNRSLVISAKDASGTPIANPGLQETDRAFLREALTRAGVPNPTDAEIRRFKENVRAVTNQPIGVLASDGQVRAALTKDGRLRVDYSDYDAGIIQAGAREILRQRAQTQAAGERAHAAGTKYVDDAVTGFYGNQANAAIDLANLATKLPRSATGTPGLPRVEVKGEYWDKPLRKEAAELAAGLALPIGQLGKAGTALIAGATATAGTQAVTGQDVETNRELTPLERGLNALGALGGAAATRNEVGQVIAKMEATAGKIGSKFPPGGGPSEQLVTPEGVTVNVPKPKATLDELATDPMKARALTNGKYAGQQFPLEEQTQRLANKYPQDADFYLQIPKKYPHGVKFKETGFPDFSPYAIKEVKIRMKGNYDSDFKAANREAGLTKTPDDYTWHHHEDRMTMQLVPKDLHKVINHDGGVSQIKKLGVLEW